MKVHEWLSVSICVTLQTIILLLMRQYAGNSNRITRSKFSHAQLVYVNVQTMAIPHSMIGIRAGDASYKNRPILPTARYTFNKFEET